jgi:hypothetical protein
MKPDTVYIEREGRQFGFETRVRIRRQKGTVPDMGADPELRSQLNAAAWTFPVLRTRLWARRHGYGWPTVI